MKVSKDGSTFFDIEDEYDLKTGENTALKQAQAKGYKAYVDVTKDGTDSYPILASELSEAQKKGYNTLDVHAAKSAKVGVSKTDALLRGVAQGGTLGFADELVAGAKAGYGVTQGKDFIPAYKQNIDGERLANKAAQDEQGGLYTTGELVGGVAVPVPGAGFIKGAGLAAKVGRAAVQGAVGGGVSSVGASEADSVGDNLLDGLKGAGSGAAIGAAFPLVGKGLSEAKRVIPGVNNAFEKVNSLTSKAASLLLGDKKNAESYRKFLDKPELYEKARVGRSELASNPQKYADTLNDLGTSLERASAESQAGRRTSAAISNSRDPAYNPLLEELSEAFKKEALIAAEAKSSRVYTDGIDEARRAFKGEDLESLRRSAQNFDPALQEGRRLHIARQLLDDKLAALENKTQSKHTTEYKNLAELRAKVDKAMKGDSSQLVSRGLSEDADNIYSNVRKSQDALKEVTQAPLGDTSAAKGYRFFKNSAGDEKAIQIKSALEKVDSTAGALGDDNIKRALENVREDLVGPQAAGELARLSAASGLTTGKSVLPVALGYAVGPAAIAALPVTNPAVYLALINAYNRGEKFAIKLLEKPEVQEGIRRAQQAFPRMFGLNSSDK